MLAQMSGYLSKCCDPTHHVFITLIWMISYYICMLPVGICILYSPITPRVVGTPLNVAFSMVCPLASISLVAPIPSPARGRHGVQSCPRILHSQLAALRLKPATCALRVPHTIHLANMSPVYYSPNM